MARPQPQRSAVQLQPKPRPEHPFAPAAAPAAESAPVAEAAVPPTAKDTAAAAPQRRNAATAASRNGGDAASRTTTGKDDLVKLSVRVHPEVNRAIKRYGIESGLSFQQIAMVALHEYFQREGHPLPDPEAG